MLLDNAQRIELYGKEVEAIFSADGGRIYPLDPIEKYTLYGERVDYAKSNGSQIMRIADITPEQAKLVNVYIDFKPLNAEAVSCLQGVISNGSDNMFIGKTPEDKLTYGNFDRKENAMELIRNNERHAVVVDYINGVYIIDSTQVMFTPSTATFSETMSFVIFGYNTGDNSSYIGQELENYAVRITIDGETIVDAFPVKLTKRAYGDYPRNSVVMWDRITDNPIEYTGDPLEGGDAAYEAEFIMKQVGDDLIASYSNADNYPTFTINNDGELVVSLDSDRPMDLRIDENGDLIQTLA